ncbi:unnamed protein product, partial [Prorocentrum cordatum]
AQRGRGPRPCVGDGRGRRGRRLEAARPRRRGRRRGAAESQAVRSGVPPAAGGAYDAGLQLDLPRARARGADIPGLRQRRPRHGNPRAVGLRPTRALRGRVIAGGPEDIRVPRFRWARGAALHPLHRGGARVEGAATRGPGQDCIR